MVGLLGVGKGVLVGVRDWVVMVGGMVGTAHPALSRCSEKGDFNSIKPPKISIMRRVCPGLRLTVR